MSQPQRRLPPAPEVIAGRLGERRRVLLFGPMGSGKSTLAEGLAGLAAAPVHVVGADPGSPAFGPPGAVTLAIRRAGGWQCLDMHPLCTLDAARFRLPLVQAVARIAGGLRDEPLIVDAPGVVRGVAGAELLQGLVAAAAIDIVVLLETPEVAPLADDIDALGCEVLRVRPADAARRPSRSERECRRTAAWDRHLACAEIRSLPLGELALVGTPPPAAVPEAWRGRQIALLREGHPIAMGELEELCADLVTVRVAADPGAADTLMIRDARRNAAGLLVTAAAAGRPPVRPVHRARDEREPVSLWVQGVGVRLVNGVLGDPLVELQVPNVAGRLLFDLGDAAALPVKALHGIGDVFVSHGHIDHIGGFPALLRGRLSGEPSPCRVYGPPGIHEHVAGFVAGVRWDRIGDNGPVFLVGEAGDEEVRWVRIQPGRAVRELPAEPLVDGVLLRRDGFTVRCATLDHGIPVLAFALELADTLRVREAALADLELTPGPWLGELKRRLAAGEHGGELCTPDGRRRRIDELADALIERVPGTRIAYATDLADTAENRRRLNALASGADLLICEATFLAEDAEQARATGHLTVAGCVATAYEARAARLLPFHFSRRYSHRLADVHRELCDAKRRTGCGAELVGPV